MSGLVQDIWDGMRAQPGRALLSFLAIAIGSVSLGVLTGVLDGLHARSAVLVQELGFNVAAVFPAESPSGQGTGAQLRDSDAALIASNCPGVIVSRACFDGVQPRGSVTRATLAATDRHMARVRQWRMREGRFLDEADLRGRERNAVASSALADELAAHVGGEIILEDTPYTLVGIVDTGGAESEADAAYSVWRSGTRSVFIPIGSVWPLQRPPAILDGRLDALFIRVLDPARYAKTLARARDLLATDAAGASRTFTWLTPDTLLVKIRKLQRSIRLSAGGITLLSLVLGGATLMSLMVANVKDRVTEIGLRRALGASRMDIAFLFVAEGCLVTSAAALAGGLLAYPLLWMGLHNLGLPAALGWKNLLVPLALALIMGAAFSYWPASVAARIAPSEALRNE